MPTDSNISKDRFLAFARKLALLTSCTGVPLAACGGASAGGPPATGPTTSASSTATTTTAATDTTPMPTDGPCRCSWDTNAAAAPRVCKKGEENYEGVACIPGHPSGEGGYYPPMKGPLPPPDLPA